jgi:NAD(P)H-dependent FMN reductase
LAAPVRVGFLKNRRDGFFNKFISEMALKRSFSILRDFLMPFFSHSLPPAMPGRSPYEHYVVKKWTAKIAAADAFVFVTPEYNYGTSAMLKNAIDWVYPEWNRKAAAFVSYGSAMGARAVQQLRETAIEVQMAPIRSSVDIPVATLWAHFQGGDVEKGLVE